MSTNETEKPVKPSRWAKKSSLIMLAIIAALAVFGTTTQTWVHVHLAQGQVQQSDLNVEGSKAAVAVSALAIVALAGALALTIAGRIARVIAGGIVFLSAVGIIAAAMVVLTNPSAAASAAVGAATGLTGQPSDASVTIFPVLAVVAGVVLALAAGCILILGRKWIVRTKYDAAAGPVKAPPRDHIDSWDQLSRGDDPTT